MAYQFVDAARLDADLTAVADAIRSKGGTAEPLAFPSGMTSAISTISTGVELNFAVVGNPEPANPEENTIWIDTDEPVTGWIFSDGEPEAPDSGMVWIQTGVSGTIVFNALKKNGLQVCPISAKQYVDGAWESRFAKSRQNGKWVDWWLGELYVAGDEYAGATGGWVFETGAGNTTAYGSREASGITVGSSSAVANFDTRATHNNFVALERFAEVKVHFTTAKTGGSSTCTVKICIYDANGTEVLSSVVLSGQSKTLSDQWHSVDVSGLPTGVYKVKIHALHTSSSKQYCYATFDEVRCV